MKTVLIIDDVESVRYYHKLLLSQAGFEAITASDGAKALDLIASRAVHLVVLDLLMPGMNGTEFLQQLHARRNEHSIPVLVISSERSPAQLPAGHRCEFMQKPLTPAILLEAVRRLLA